MFKFRKNSSSSISAEDLSSQDDDNSMPAADSAEQTNPKEEKSGWFSSLKRGLRKTGRHLGQGATKLLRSKKQVDADLLEELETLLLMADVGVDTTDIILSQVKDRASQMSDTESVLGIFKQVLVDLLSPCEVPLELVKQPASILMVGINGAGKTTSIAKIAHYFQQQGVSKMLLAAGDTFRAAAVEQLKTWGERNAVPVIAQHQGADSASVIYDAMESTLAKNMDLLIADTAGRLHTQDHLMEELKKVKRVMSKLDADAPSEVMMVLDATLGQNAIQQCQQFHAAVGVTGLCITKLDGSAKGGIVFALAHQFNIPIRFIGVGESMEDLKPFVAKDFVEALFANDE